MFFVVDLRQVTTIFCLVTFIFLKGKTFNWYKKGSLSTSFRRNNTVVNHYFYKFYFIFFELVIYSLIKRNIYLKDLRGGM